jgi:hypothetical protein
MSRGSCKGDLGWPAIKKSTEIIGLRATYDSLIRKYGRLMVNDKFRNLITKEKISPNFLEQVRRDEETKCSNLEGLLFKRVQTNQDVVGEGYERLK